MFLVDFPALLQCLVHPSEGKRKQNNQGHEPLRHHRCQRTLRRTRHQLVLGISVCFVRAQDHWPIYTKMVVRACSRSLGRPQSQSLTIACSGFFCRPGYQCVRGACSAWIFWLTLKIELSINVFWACAQDLWAELKILGLVFALHLWTKHPCVLGVRSGSLSRTEHQSVLGVCSGSFDRTTHQCVYGTCLRSRAHLVHQCVPCVWPMLSRSLIRIPCPTKASMYAWRSLKIFSSNRSSELLCVCTGSMGGTDHQSVHVSSSRSSGRRKNQCVPGSCSDPMGRTKHQCLPCVLSGTLGTICTSVLVWCLLKFYLPE